MAGAEDFATLARRLKDMGETGLRAELFKGVDEAIRPFEEKIRDPFTLYPYMPDRYVNVLEADLKVSASKRTSRVLYGVQIRVQGRTRNRQVRNLEAGMLRHPVFGRMSQPWKTQVDGMKEGFFSDTVKATRPAMVEAISEAMTRVREKLANG